ncbi:MAG: hypothetical protein J5I90_09285, partial [Caldilineales bacterium]|nr:hypothetical protein [Caldilineales bacterium]
MNRKYFLIVLLLVIAMLVLQACGGAAPAEQPAAPQEAAPTVAPAASDSNVVSIAYLNKMGDNPWFVDEVAGARAKADELGVEFFNQDLQFDS